MTVSSSPWWRVPAPIPTLIFINLTAHLAMSGGRLTGALFTLKSGAGEMWAGAFMGMFAAIPLFTSLRTGRWIDRVGPRLVMQRGSVLVVLGAWLPVFFLSVPILFAMALLVGIGFNLVSMAALHVAGSAGNAATSRQRIANFGWLGLGFSTSAALGPSVAGLLIDTWGYRTSLIATACCSVVAVLLVFTRTGRSIPVPSAANSRGERASIPRGLFSLGRRPRLRRLLLVGLSVASSWDLFMIMLPVIGTRLHFSASVVGAISSTFAVGVFLSRVLTPWLASRLTEWQTVRGCMAVITLIFLALPFVEASSVWTVFALALGLAVGLTQPTTLSLIHAATPTGRGGEAIGMRYFLGNCSSVLIPVAFGMTIGVVGVLPLLWVNAAWAGFGLRVAHRGAVRAMQRG